ncbi:MAG TPA: phosphatidylglycerol lysyltransferase domain-containing protein [Smithellaceae bacterium]|jgi:hypothetical protein|nr:phosphatidylglycerol lysyltransferase domain-containing protein [Smithellaceae bacterium]HPL98067.1 phosphatidylglycerol lysyltransferase domain-containing protein [Smithellaceae bacterium]HQF84376.1 phosphatidylglycerol lysyltransferase domain-containing protein [Smithellaceae bacterium]HQG80653.1 phosphatidylglycerol lysyltransferase domain-containing protein [Smithellaceae bacterium]
MDITENIELKHRPFLAARFCRMHLNISDYTFANVYLFRNISRYSIRTKSCGTFISAYNARGQNYIMPLDSPADCSKETLTEFLDGENFFFPIPEEWLRYFPSDTFSISFDDSESDYIYLTSKMASFSGKQFTRHRNHLNQFFGAHRADGRPLGSETLPDAMTVLQIWQDESRLPAAGTDFAVCAEALQNFSDLALWGTIYYIDGRPAGFIIGEPLNSDMFCLHFAKGSRQYHGIYQFMFNDTAKKLEDDYKFLNLEEDMGDKNLKKTKLSYGPQQILKKYRIGLKAGI